MHWRGFGDEIDRLAGTPCVRDCSRRWRNTINETSNMIYNQLISELHDARDSRETMMNV
jgi:hypothetical protein